MWARTQLTNNQEIDLKKLPSSLIWRKSSDNGQNEIKSCFEAKRNKLETCVAIHEIPQKAYALARRLGGHFYSDEEVEGKDFVNICKLFGVVNGETMALKLLEFAAACCNGIQKLSTIKNKIQKHDYNMRRISAYRAVAEILVDVVNSLSYKGCYEFLCIIEKNGDFEVFRKELWSEFKRVLSRCMVDGEKSPTEIAVEIWRCGNLCNKYNYNNIVSRVLLIKGLEYDQAIVLAADGLSKKEFYVAISRPKYRLVIISNSQTILFK